MKKYFLIFFCAAAIYFGGAKPYERQITLPIDPGPILFNPPEPFPTPLPPCRDCPAEYLPIIEKEAENAGIPIEILESIIWVESGFRATAQSPPREDGHRDVGICQFNSKYLDWFSDQYNSGILFDPMDPGEAIRIAALHIRYLYERYGSWPEVCIAYNAGMCAVDRDEIPESSLRYLIRIYERESVW